MELVDRLLYGNRTPITYEECELLAKSMKKANVKVETYYALGTLGECEDSYLQKSVDGKTAWKFGREKIEEFLGTRTPFDKIPFRLIRRQKENGKNYLYMGGSYTSLGEGSFSITIIQKE